MGSELVIIDEICHFTYLKMFFVKTCTPVCCVVVIYDVTFQHVTESYFLPVTYFIVCYSYLTYINA